MQQENKNKTQNTELQSICCGVVTVMIELFSLFIIYAKDVYVRSYNKQTKVVVFRIQHQPPQSL